MRPGRRSRRLLVWGTDANTARGAVPRAPEEPVADERKPFTTAVGLLRRTTPFLLLNAMVYAGFFLAIVAWLAAFGGLAAFFANRIEVLAFIFLLIAIGGPGALLALARRYLLYLVQGAHIAAATTLFLHGSIPDGQGQVAYGRAEVRKRFRDVSILFAVDRAVHGVVSAFTRKFVRIADMLPLGNAVSNLARIGATIVNRSVSYVDEAILSYAIAKEEDNVWRSARHGVILYAQSYKPILGAAVKIWLLGKVAFVALLIILGIPGVLLLLTFDAVWFQVVVFVAVVMLAWLIMAATYEPFAAVYTLVTYHRAIEGVEVNAVWDQRLQQVSKRFKEIVGKAQQGGGGPDPLDTATVPQEAMQLNDPNASPPDSSGPTGGGGGAGAGGNPLAGLRSASRGGGIGGMVGGLLSQVGQQSSPGQQPAQQPSPESPPAAQGPQPAPQAPPQAPAEPSAPPQAPPQGQQPPPSAAPAPQTPPAADPPSGTPEDDDGPGSASGSAPPPPPPPAGP